VAEIQRNVIKQGKRNVISRHLHAKNDKDKIAAWKSDLNRILQIFNVRSIVTVWRSLTLDSQTELAINTHVTVSETHAIVTGLEHDATSTRVMVSDIHRTLVKGQESNVLLVSDARTLSTTE